MRRLRAASIACAFGWMTSLFLARTHPFSDAGLFVPAFAQSAHEKLLMEGDSTAEAAGEGDPDRGNHVFERRCTGCHALTQDREGPRLQGVYGRTSGEVPGFAYSPALKHAHIVWSDTTLDQWLTDPDTLVPGNNMDFHVPKPQERRDLIEFLKQSAKK